MLKREAAQGWKVEGNEVDRMVLLRLTSRAVQAARRLRSEPGVQCGGCVAKLRSIGLRQQAAVGENVWLDVGNLSRIAKAQPPQLTEPLSVSRSVSGRSSRLRTTPPEWGVMSS